ncbi:MAG: hypothetical protein HDT30_00495 [Clostridiales bacterium]|nr:hypothetical protein [Clostridiales bacterium]
MRKTRLLALLCAGILCVNCFSGIPVYGHTKTNGEKVKEKYEERGENNRVKEKDIKIQNKLNQKYKKLKDEMTISQKSNGEVEYEDYYAGAYINEEQLVVCVTDATDILEDAIGDEYRIVKNSYNEMDEIVEEIGDKYSKLYGTYSNDTEEYILLNSIVGFGIDEEKNFVEVDILELNEKKEKIFHKLFGKYDCVKLQNAEGKMKDCTAYKPGRKLYVITEKNGTNIKRAFGSMGYRAYRNTASGERRYGFVTCGHSFMDSVDGKVYTSSALNTVIGKVGKTQYSGSVDAAFIRLANGNTVSNKVQYDSSGSTSDGDTIASFTYMLSVAKGATVYKVGATSYKTSAKVLNTKYTYTINGVKFTNLTKTEDFCSPGDSGGLVYTYYDSQYQPCGIVKGKGSGYTVYVKASEIGNAINAYPY